MTTMRTVEEETPTARAEALARAGDTAAALRCAEEALTTADPTESARAVGIAATLLTHRGLTSTAASLYRGAGTADVGPNAALAAVTMFLTGAIDEAVAFLDVARENATPTLVVNGKLMTADGIQVSLHGSPTAALSRFVNATSLMEASGGAVLLPNTPAAIGAILATHCGEFATAATILDRAIRGDLGGPAFRARHRLLRAWVAMQTGQLATARKLRDEVLDRRRPLELRDEYLTHALTAGIARRSSDVVALQTAWQRARETVLEFQVDLLSLLPFGELILAAARAREPFRLDVQLDDAMTLLERLGQPALWAAMVHWQLLQASILGETPHAMALHVDELQKHAPVSGFHAALADAAAAWQRTMAGDVDFAATSAAARGLDAHGLPWDASRLAAQAAARTTDRKVMVDLLQCARQLQPVDADPSVAPSPEPGRTEREAEAADGDLSRREFEVARLVLAGQTYREIGENLFISSKTVEHHIARIRKRLGATNRSELFALMQAALDRSGGAHDAAERSMWVTSE